MIISWLKTEKLADSLVGSHRAESTDQDTARSGITTKIPPLSDGSTSWSEHEELNGDWLDLTVLEAENEVQRARDFWTVNT